jgi:hypothetical protein
MKSLTLIAAMTALTGLLSASSAFAADAATSAPSASSEMVAMSDAVVPAPAMQFEQNAGKTRAEVYQELIHSEKSGEYQRLNSTLYAN